MITLIIVMIVLGVYMLRMFYNYKEYKKYKEGYELISKYIFKKYDFLRFDKFILTPVSTTEIIYNSIYNDISENQSIHSCIANRKRYHNLMIRGLENEEKDLKKQYKDGQISLDEIQSLLNSVLAAEIA